MIERSMTHDVIRRARRAALSMLLVAAACGSDEDETATTGGSAASAPVRSAPGDVRRPAVGAADEAEPAATHDAPLPAALLVTLLRPLDHEIDDSLAGRLDKLPAPGKRRRGLHPHEIAARELLEAEWRERAARHPGDVGAWLDLAERLLWLGDVVLAEGAAVIVLQSRPDQPRAAALLSAVRFDQARIDEGRMLADRALAGLAAGAPVPYLALVGRGRTLASLGPPFLARDALERAMDQAPERPEAPYLVGQLLTEVCAFDEALPYLERAAAHAPDPAGGKHATLMFARNFAALLGDRTVYGGTDDGAAHEFPIERRPSLAAVYGQLRDGSGGHVGGWFVIDTGASMTVVGPEAAPLLRRSPTLGARAETADGPLHLEPALLPVLQLGSLTLTDVPVLLDADQPAPIGPGVIGTLGVSLLRRFHVVIDVRAGRLELRPPLGSLKLAPPQLAADEELVTGRTSFELQNNLLLVPGRFGNGRWRRFVFDSGADGLFLDPAVITADLGLDPADPRWPHTVMVGLGGRESRTAVVPVPGVLEVGGVPFAGLTATVDPSAALRSRAMRMDSAGTMGLLTPARWALDFALQELRFDVVANPER